MVGGGLPTMSLSQQSAAVASSTPDSADGRVRTTTAPKLTHPQSAAHKEQDRRAKLQQWRERKEMQERTAEKKRLSASASSSRPLGFGKENTARVLSTTAVSG